MEQVTQPEIDLFAATLPSTDELQRLSNYVNSGERDRIAFGEKLEEHLSETKPNTVLATGIGLYIISRDAEAIEKLSKATDCKEKYIYMALAARRSEKFDDAIEYLEKSLSAGADSLTVALEKAATYRKAKNLDAAANELKACTNFVNVSAEYHCQLGRLLEAEGEYTEAMDNYKIALELSPEHERALFHLAYRCDLSGDEHAAVDYYQQIAAKSPIYVSALMNLAVLYEDLGKFYKAANCVELVLESHPNHKRAQLFLKDIESSMTMYYDEEKEKRRTRKNQILETPISDFELSVRSRNCLKKMNIRTLGDLLDIAEAELLSYKNFGETSLREIKVILDSKGLHLGMALDDKGYAAPEQAVTEEEDEDNALLAKPVEDLQLSVRARKCLSMLNARSIGELTRRTEAELLGCKNFGMTSLNEIKKALASIGLSLRSLD